MGVRVTGPRTACSGSGACLDLQPFSLSPQSFKIVELALFGREDVDDEIAVVHQDPAPVVVALGMRRVRACNSQLLDDVVGDGLSLRPGISGAHDEAVGERAETSEVQNHHMDRLLVERGFNRDSDFFGKPGWGFSRLRRRKLLLTV